MPKYLVEVAYTADGMKGLVKVGGSARRTVVEQTTAEVGGTLEAFYYTFGDRDAIIIVDLPNNVAAAALSLVVNATGAIHSSTTPLLTPEDIDAAARDHVEFRAPGQ